MRYFPKAPANAGKKTLAPTVNDSDGCFTATSAMKQIGGNVASTWMDPKELGNPKVLKRHLGLVEEIWSKNRWPGMDQYYNTYWIM